jgi:hypothetical protein
LAWRLNDVLDIRNCSGIADAHLFVAHLQRLRSGRIMIHCPPRCALPSQL